MRASCNVSVSVEDADSGQRVRVPQKIVNLRGPGDVMGFDPRTNRASLPHEQRDRREEIFLAHIEFDRPGVAVAVLAVRCAG